MSVSAYLEALLSQGFVRGTQTVLSQIIDN